MIPADFLVFVALPALLLALVVSWNRRFNTACTRNVISTDIDCDVTQAREGILQLTADVERLHTKVIATRRDMAQMKEDRGVIGLPVKTAGQVSPRRSPSAPTIKVGDTFTRDTLDTRRWVRAWCWLARKELPTIRRAYKVTHVTSAGAWASVR